MSQQDSELANSSENHPPITMGEPQTEATNVAPTHDDNTSTTQTQTPAPEPKPSLCGVCNENPPKYKCPRCYLPYCSVACNKVHKENHPPDPEPRAQPEPSQPTPQSSDVSPIPPASSSDPSDPFRALESSDKLRLLFKKYPNLPSKLLQIHAATLPPPEPTSSKPAIPASLLKGLPPQKETWNHDIGVQNGKEALRKAMRADDEDGEAVREYSELVLHIMNTSGASADVGNILREQLAKQDAELIERLMAQEKR